MVTTGSWCYNCYKVSLVFVQLFIYVSSSHKHKNHKNILCWKGPIRIVDCSLQNYLKLNHITKSIVHMLLQLWQPWCHDHLPGEHIPVTNHLLRKWRTFSQCAIWTSPDADSFHFHVSYQWSPERRDCHLPFPYSPWRSCRLQWDHLSVFSKLNKIK